MKQSTLLKKIKKRIEALNPEFIIKNSLVGHAFKTTYQSKYSKQYYETATQKYRDGSYLEKILTLGEDFVVQETKQEITYKGLAFGASIKEVQKKLGAPVTEYTFSHTPDYIVLFYKFVLGPLKTKAEIHFYKDKLVLGIYFFDPKQKVTLLAQSLSKKYNSGISFKHFSNLCLIDNNNNTLLVSHHNFDLCLFYVYRKTPILAQAVQQLKNKTKSEASKEKIYLRKIEEDI